MEKIPVPLESSADRFKHKVNKINRINQAEIDWYQYCQSHNDVD